MESEKSCKLLYACLASINASLGFLFFTYNLSIFGALMNFLEDYVFPDTSSSVLVLLTSAPFITAIIASVLGGPIAGRIGRRKLMMIVDIIGIVGVILTLIASVPIVLIGRLCIGFTVGTTTVAVPLYFIEMSPVKYRGPISSAPTIFASSGMFIAFLLGLAVPKTLQPGETSQVWRVLLSLSILMALARFLNFLIFFRHETPDYLVGKDRLKEALDVLNKVYKTGAKERLDELIRERNFMASQGTVRLRELPTKKYRKALFVGIIIMSMQQLAPLNVICVFAQDIFEEGVSPSSNLPRNLAIILAAVNVVAGCCSMYTSSKFGRKPLLVIGAFFTGLCSILFGVLGLAVAPESMASKIFLILWPIPFALSLGPITFAIVSESLPDKAVSVATVFNWIWSFLTVQFYPDVSEAMGVEWTFIMLGGITILSSAFFLRYVIETKGKNKDEILRQYSGLESIEAKIGAQPRLKHIVSDAETEVAKIEDLEGRQVTA